MLDAYAKLGNVPEAYVNVGYASAASEIFKYVDEAVEVET